MWEQWRQGETSGCVRCVSMLGRRGSLWNHGINSCKQFSLHRTLHADELEAATLFLDTQEESLGPARDAPSHCVLIHLGPRDVDSGFHLHLVLGMACEGLLQHFVDLVLPSRPDVVVERLEISRICRKSWREQCGRGRPVRCRANSPWYSGDAIFTVEGTKCGSQIPPSNVAVLHFSVLQRLYVWKSRSDSLRRIV